ncbi:sorbitol dehydrogenase-like [Eriocheir sinensis]|uniref:sorbitol dehydrogenase-like n=1 Tax=Eriocheir sinensis TaxID=95602 RepID=UPI0021C651CB|nr:sorbitol dehydrogenase-like [Eriocheir sinensis]
MSGLQGDAGPATHSSLCFVMDNTFPVLHGVKDLRLETHPIPELRDDQVLIRMSKVGLCGTDISMVYKGRTADLDVTFPTGVGHEASGVVSKCGKDVTHVKPGDRVTIEPGSFCRTCDHCLSGRYNVCDKSSFHASVAMYPGCLARYFVYQGHLTYKLPDSISDEEGAIVEPLAVAVHACRRAGVWAGQSMLVTGAGPIGLLCLVVAKALGATNTLVTDIKESRLELAKKMGADHTLLVGSGTSQSQAKQVHQMMGCEPDVTMECSGSQAGISLAIYATKSRGKVMQVGLSGPEVTVPLVHAGVREVDIMGVFRYLNTYPIAIDLLAKKLVDVNPLITHRFKFEEFQKAFDMFYKGEDGAVKCMISC